MKDNSRCSRFRFFSRIFTLSISTSFIGLLLGSWSAQAATYNWNCTSGNWANTACWSPNGIPIYPDTIYVSTVSSANTLLTVDSATTANAGTLYIDASAGTTVNLQQTGGEMHAFSEYVGYSSLGTSVYTQSGGSNIVANGSLYVGYGSGSDGTYNLSNIGSLWDNSTEYIGYSGTGTFTQSGGTNHTQSALSLGINSGSNGTYNLIAGNLSNAWVELGNDGIGTFTQNGGSHTTNDIYIGNGTGSGTYNLINGNLSGGLGEYVGNASNGTFTQSGGTNAVYALVLGRLSGSNGTYNLDGGILTVNGGNIQNGAGTSTLNISNGTLTVGGGNGSISVGNLVLGSITGSNVNYALTSTGLYQGVNKVAGALTTGNLVIGKDGAGTFTQTNGANMTTGTVTLAANAGSSGTYNLNGGSLHAANITVNSGGTFNFNGGTLAVNQFNGNLANLGGTLAPGNSPGITNVTGNYSQSGAGIFAVEIGGTGLGQFDILNISGAATLDGTLSVSLFDWGSGLFTPQVGDSFDILTAQILSGQFSTLNLAALDNGLAWNISYLTDAIDTTDIVRLSVVSAVPLPPAFWLFGSGLLGLIGIARKRKFH